MTISATLAIWHFNGVNRLDSVMFAFKFLFLVSNKVNPNSRGKVSRLHVPRKVTATISWLQGNPPKICNSRTLKYYPQVLLSKQSRLSAHHSSTPPLPMTSVDHQRVRNMTGMEWLLVGAAEGQGRPFSSHYKVHEPQPSSLLQRRQEMKITPWPN